MKKKILYLLPFILYSIFYSIIIFVLRGTLVFPDFLLLLALFTLSFALIRMGIDNTYFILAETKVAILLSKQQ